jgi:hypothetical protein
MKNILKAVFGVLLLAAGGAYVSAQSGSSGRLAGSWDVVVTPRVCATGDPITTFQAAYYFTPGGTFSGVSSGTGSGGRGREQLGVWAHVSGNRYRFRIKTYLFDAAGAATSYQIVNHEGLLERSGLRWSSVGDSRTYSLDGVQINAGCSTIVAARMDAP